MQLSPDGKTIISISQDDLKDGHLTIPNTVLMISKEQFQDYINLSVLTIPKEVIVNDFTFFKHPGLTQIILGERVRIEQRAFLGCTGLASLIIPKGVTLDYAAFAMCSSLRELTISQDVTIGYQAFMGCKGFASLHLPERVKIGFGAFRDCTGLISLSVAEDVTIENAAFMNCSNLSVLNISQGVMIGSMAFYECTGLVTLNLSARVSVLSSAFEKCTGLTTLCITEGVILDSSAFKGCTNLCRIIVVTNSDEELDRIKSLFPEHAHAQFVKQTVYNKVISLQERAYRQIIQEPQVSVLFGLHEYLGLPVEVLSYITTYASPLFKQAVSSLTFPTNEDELGVYEQKLQDLVLDIKKCAITETKKSQCIVMLKEYIHSLMSLITQKSTEHSGYFASEPKLFTRLMTQVNTVFQLILYLEGVTSVQFSQDDLALLNTGYVGETLARFGILVTELPLYNKTNSINPFNS